MTESERIPRRQTEWQRSRRLLSWPVKIRQAERMRPSIEALRGERLRRRHRARLRSRRRRWSPLTANPRGAASRTTRIATIFGLP